MLDYRVVIAACLLLPFHNVSAQEAGESTVDQTADSKAKPLTEIAVVAVGPAPPRRYKDAGGNAPPIMLLPTPGEIPPSRLYYKGRSSSEGKSDWQTFNVTFNNPSTMKSVVPEKSLSLYRKDKESGEYKLYVTIPPGTLGSRRVFFLIPSTTGRKLWDKPPLVRTINLDSKTLEGKQFILKNLSSFTVLHAFANSVTSVPPMKTISYTRPKSGELYRLAARYGTQKKIIYNTAVKLDTHGNIQLFALYNASPQTNAGRSVGVFRMMIPARPAAETAAP